MLKLPKYIRIIKGFLYIFEGKLANIIDLDDYIQISSYEYIKLQKFCWYTLIYIGIANIMACLMVSFTKQCYTVEDCQNWFYPLMESEFNKSLYDSNSRFNQITNQLSEQNPNDTALYFYNYILSNERYYLYFDAWYYVIQTFTTVGYGDIGTNQTHERVFRSICMIFGVFIYTMYSSMIMDYFISETLNIYRKNEHDYMINKLQNKYQIRGESKQLLGMLGDSVYTESLNDEIQFASLLPDCMSTKVLKQIWQVYYHKINLIHEESMNFFVKFMKLSSFRRSIENEVFLNNYIIRVIYSGRVGCLASNLSDYMNHDYLQILNIGNEFGYLNYFNYDQTLYNLTYECVDNSEILEISSDDYVDIMFYSLKGLDYINDNLVEFITEIILLAALFYCKLNSGIYIDYQHYKKLLQIIDYNENDRLIFVKVLKNLKNGVEKKKINDVLYKKYKAQQKWYLNIIDNEIIKYVYLKSKNLVIKLLSKDYEALHTYIKTKHTIRSSN